MPRLPRAARRHRWRCLDGVRGGTPFAPAPFPQRIEVAMPSDSQPPSLRVLVIDDNVDTATTLSLLLEQWGYKTAVAFEGEDGVRLSALFLPHVCIIDLNLPDLNGCDVARQIRASDPRPQTLICFSGKVDGLSGGQAAVFDIVASMPMERSRLFEILEMCRSKMPPDVVAPAWWRIGGAADLFG